MNHWGNEDEAGVGGGGEAAGGGQTETCLMLQGVMCVYGNGRAPNLCEILHIVNNTVGTTWRDEGCRGSTIQKPPERECCLILLL